MLTHTTLTCVYRFWLIVLILGTNSCAQVVAPPAPAAHPTSAASGVTIASPDPSTPTTPSDGGASTPEKECTLNDGFRGYLTCAKKKVSTTALIGGGIGVTIAIFLLVGLLILCVNRGKKKEPSMTPEVDAVPDEVGKHNWDGAMPVPAVPHGTMTQRGKEWDYPPVEKQYPPRPPQAQGRDRFTARVESVSDQEDYSQPPQPVLNSGSPSNPTGLPRRTLYPTNPSPVDNHLPAEDSHRFPVAQPSLASSGAPLRSRQPGLPSAMRQSTHSARPRRDSIASVHFAGAASEPLPRMPEPIRPPPIERFGTTQPLTVRKSVAPSMIREPMDIPSYYAATGEPSWSDIDRAEGRPRQSVYGRSMYSTSSSESSPPPLPPYASRPSLSGQSRLATNAGSGGRRPPAARKGIEDRGGLI